MAEDAHFHDDFREEVSLKDGSKVLLRPLRASDRELLRRGFAHLSPESRYLRFLIGKARLSDKELDYFTRVDGSDHFAMGASRRGADGQEEGLGVGRFVRLEPGGAVAEPAITVVDEMHGKGLGTILLHRLSAAARERGVERFHCEFLASNERIRHMLNDLAPDARFVAESGVMVSEFPLPATPAAEDPANVDREGIIHQLFGLHAAGDIVVRMRDSILKWTE